MQDLTAFTLYPVGRAKLFFVALCFYGSREETVTQLKRGVCGEPDSQKWVHVTKSLENPALKNYQKSSIAKVFCFAIQTIQQNSGKLLIKS